MELDQQDIEEKKNLEEIISQRIKIYPTKKQRNLLSQWFGVQRWVYNKCLERHNLNQKNNVKTTLADLRTNIINNSNFETENSWMLEYHYDLRDEAVRDFIKNIKSNLAKGGKFTLQFKSLKIQRELGCSLSVLKKHWNKPRNFYSDLFNPRKLKSSQSLPKNLPSDSRISRSSTNKYFILIPKTLVHSDSQAVLGSQIFMDPGVNGFVTGYDPSGKIIVWGEKDVGRIARLLHYKNRLRSKIQKEKKCYRKRNLRLAMLRTGEKINNLVKDLHRKLAKFLCQNYSEIYLPRLNFHNFRKLNRKDKANMAALKHCAFLDYLKFKAKGYGCKVFEVNEARTSKTCSSCGFLKNDLGKSRVFKCDRCSIRIGRDVNASKNIMLRYFTKLRAVYDGIEA
jgi:IS605 OrfB family transposase